MDVLTKCRYNINGFVEELPSLPTTRYGHICAALPSSGVRLNTVRQVSYNSEKSFQAFVVAGGWERHPPFNRLSSVVTLLPGGKAWTPLADLPRPLYEGAGASIVGGKIRVVGGGAFESEVILEN